MRSSQKSVDLIVEEEVSSKEVYEKKYQHPEWPGAQSGCTVGIGYDLGYSTPQRIHEDWGPYLPADMLAAMARVAGLTGQKAHEALAGLRGTVVVPWDPAMAVFEKRDMPRWENAVLKAIPAAANLSPDCFGVIVSIAYNRGASFAKDGDRYKEMRDIRAHITSGEYDKVPDDIRNMKRLWDGSHGQKLDGLVRRREREAALFEAGIRDIPGPVQANPPVTSVGNEDDTPLNVQPKHAKYDLDLEIMQQKLLRMHYFELGDADGKWGGKTRGAVTAFLNDRGVPLDGLIDDKGFVDLEARDKVNKELSRALSEEWSRPIAPARANATSGDIEHKLRWLQLLNMQKVWGWFLAIPSAATAVFKGLFGEQADVNSYVTSIKTFFGNIPPELYWGTVAAIGIAVVVQATKAQTTTVKAYQRGEIN